MRSSWMSSIFAMDRSGSETPDGPDRVAIVRPVGLEMDGTVGIRNGLRLFRGCATHRLEELECRLAMRLSRLLAWA